MKQSKAKRFALSFLATAMLCGIMNPIPIYAEETKKENGVQAQTYDTTKPVFEKLEFSQNGKTVKVGDKLPVYVYAYDADSGIDKVTVYVGYSDEKSELYDSNSVSLENNEKEKRYEGEIEVIDGGYTLLELQSVRIVDNSSNIMENQLYDDQFHKLYKAAIEGGSLVETKVYGKASKVEISKMHQTVSDKEELTFSVYVPENISNDTHYISVGLKNDDQGWYTYIDLYKSDKNHNLYTGTSTLTDNGKYILEELNAYNENYKKLGKLSYENKNDVWINVLKDDNIAPTLESIEMTHKGEFVKPGDKINIRIKAKDNVQLDEYGYIHLSPVMYIDTYFETVELTYNSKENIFEGTFEITDKTYPCEWYVSDLDIRDTSDNKLDTTKLNLKKDNYFLVKNGETFVNPTYDINVSFSAINENGVAYTVKSFNEKKVDRRTKWREIINELPDGSTAYKGLKFQGWVDYEGNILNLDDEILGDHYSGFTALYDKKIVNINYIYPNKELTDSNGQNGYHEELLLDNSATYKDVIEHINNKKFKDMYDQIEFIGWQFYGMDTDPSTGLSPINNFDCYAGFKDKLVVKVIRYYYDETGADYNLNPLNKIKYEFVDKGTTYNTLWKKYQKENVKHYDGLRFKNWSNQLDASMLESEIDNNFIRYADFYITANYENCLVNFILKNSSDFYNSEVVQFKSIVVEKGESITIPENIGDYRNIKWYPMIRIEYEDGTVYYMTKAGGFGWGGPSIIDVKDIEIKGGDQLDIYSDTNFHCYEDGSTEPSKPTEPNKPIEKPLQPNTPNINPVVNNKLSQAIIQESVAKIADAKDGETIDINMDHATFVPKAILEALKGKNVTVNLNMNGYTWSINGKDIMASNLEDINLAVTFNTNHIPNKIVNQLAQGNPVKQLSLAHNGDFGFKANLSFNIGTEYKGKFGNLYYYDSDGKMVYMNAGQIKDDGMVSLSFSHASEYALVISDMIAPNTGDTTNASAYALLLIAAFGFGSFLLWKKRKENA